MLGHVGVHELATRLQSSPNSVYLHDGVRRQDPAWPGGRDLDRAASGEAPGGIRPCDGAAEILIANYPLRTLPFINREAGAIGAGPDVAVCVCAGDIQTNSAGSICFRRIQTILDSLG